MKFSCISKHNEKIVKYIKMWYKFTMQKIKFLQKSIFIILVNLFFLTGCSRGLKNYNPALPLHTVLPNGMHVILNCDHSVPLTAVHLAVKTGSIHEQGYYGCGLSHFFEHSLFLGSSNHPQKDSLAAEIESYGGRDINAYTTSDHTAYHFTVLSAHISNALSCMADLVFHPLFPAADVKNEMGSILSEIDMNMDDPNRVFYNFISLFSFEHQPYRYPVIGWREKFSRLTAKELFSWYKSSYIPANMILSVSGDIPVEALLAYITNVFGIYKGKTAQNITFAPEPPWTRRTAVIRHPKARGIRVSFLWQTVSFYSPDMYPLDLLASALGSGEGSILHTDIKEKKKLAEQISCSSWTPSDAGIFAITCVLPEIPEPEIAGRISEVEAAVFSNLNAIAANALPAGRFAESRRAVLSDFVYSKQGVMAQARSFAGSVMNSGGTDFDRVYLDGISAVSPQAVKNAVKKYFSPGRMKTAIMLPDQTAVSAIGRNFEDIRPEVREIKTITFNEKSIPGIKGLPTPLAQIKYNIAKTAGKEQAVKKNILANGLRLLKYSSPALPVVAVSIAAAGGQAAEGKDLPPGSFNLASRLFLSSCPGFSREELLLYLRRHGISIAPFSGKNSFGFTMSFLSDKTEEAGRALAAILKRKKIASEDFTLEKNDVLFSLNMLRENGWRESGNYFRKSFFPGTPYAWPGEGTPETVSNITADTVGRLFMEYFCASNMTAGIYGDIIKTGKIVKIFSGLPVIPAPVIPAVHLPELPVFSADRTVINYFPGSRQAFVRLGFRAPPLGHNEAPIFRILENCLSGMGGPLFTLRSEDGGRAYQLGSFYDMSRDYGALVFYAVLREDRSKEYDWAISSFIKETLKLATVSLPAAAAERGIALALGQEYSALQDISGRALNDALFELYGLGAGFQQAELEKCRKVTAQDITAISRRYFIPARALPAVMLP